MRSLLLAVFLFLTCRITAQTQFYVSPGGDDASAGTLVQPWKTVQHALDNAAPGCTIFLMGGTYRENAVATISGTAGNPVRVANYNNENAVLDGSLSGGAPLLRISNVNYFIVEGIEFANHMLNGAQGILVEGACDHVEIRRNRLHDIHFSANASDIPGSTHRAQAIVVKGNSTAAITNLVISGNEIYNCRTAWHSAIYLSGNMEGFTITSNRVHDVNHDGIGLAGHTGTCTDANLDQPRNGMLRWNKVQASLTGIVLDGTANCMVENNTLTGNIRGMIITCNTAGNTADGITVRNNLVHANSYGGILAGGFDYPLVTGKVTGLLVCNNTLISNSAGVQTAGEIAVFWCENAAFNSNLVYINTSVGGPFVDVQFNLPSVSFSHNLYYSTAAPEWHWNGSTAATLSSWASLSNSEQYSVYADPLFVNGTQNDFHLDPSSPAIDAGDSAYIATQGETDMDTMSRLQNGRVDIGADEYGTAVGILVAENINVPALLYDRAAGQITVSFASPAKQDSRIDLLSADGKLISSAQLTRNSNSVQFSTSGLANGTYFIFCRESSVALKFVK